MHGGIGGGRTMRILSNGDGMTMSGLWKISETKGIYIKKNNMNYSRLSYHRSIHKKANQNKSYAREK